MHAEQSWWSPEGGWSRDASRSRPLDADWLLVFGATQLLDRPDLLDELRQRYPRATLFGCSTAGEIQDVRVHDDTLVATAVAFESTRLRAHRLELTEDSSSEGVGEALGAALCGDDLVHVMVLSDGLNVNGSALITGLTASLPAGVTISGGLAGDGANMGRTLVCLDETTSERQVAAIGLYGRSLDVSCGSLGGWDPFGPEREITRSEGNVLYELDGQNALGLYETYLGERAAELPASALLFPLSLRHPDGSSGIVRTVLSIDREQRSMTFAGDLPEGSFAQLMKANFERLIDGAVGAARASVEGRTEPPALAVLISCVGRKLVLQQRIEEEVEAVRDVLGEAPILTGFYSLGEISPFTPSGRCELHNQTMTITTFAET